MKILSAEQIRKWDEYTIANEPVKSVDLMERAATKCVEWFAARFANTTAVKIFCGKGNNGGDGLAIARMLAEQAFRCDVYIIELGAAGTPDFQANLTRLHSSPVQIHFIQQPEFFPELKHDDVVVDAMLGSGLNRPVEGLYAQAVEHINNAGAKIVSIDIPSGLFTDKATSSVAVKATDTLTFQSIKLGLLFPENEQYFGEVTVLDIGLLPAYLDSVTSIYQLADARLIRHIYKARKCYTHKGTYGHALVVAGEKGKMGAAILCTKACLRGGAGLVTAVVPGEQFVIIQTAVPEAMAMPHEEMKNTDWGKYTAIGIGCGIGTSEHGAMLLHEVLASFNKPIVADADALNLISMNRELLNELPPGSILTPHPKEFERLFGKSANYQKRMQKARQFAQKYFVYIILKGHNSMLACPDGEVYFNSTGNAGMATGGTGDVLTGIITALLAQGYLPKEAALLGMYVHGLAADIAVKTTSMEALIAGDVVSHLGRSFLSLHS